MRGLEQKLVPGGSRRSSIALAATAAGAAMALIGAASTTPAAAKDIKVCLIAGKTGPFEAYAKQTENGFMMGLEYLTKNTMTVGADKLLVLVKDDQLKPDRGKSLLEECYDDDKVDLAVGTTGSPVALAMLPVAEEKKKVLIVEPAVADSITGDKRNRYIFRTGRSSYQDALAGAASFPKSGEVSLGMLGLDTAFGRDGVAAFKKALAGIRPNVKIVAEEYAAGNTADFAPFAERLFNALKDKPGKKVIGFIWAGPHPMAKFVDMKPDRFGIELAPGGNILPVMNAWKQFAGTEGGIYYYYDFPKNPMNDWLKAEYRKRFNAPPDFFVAGGFAAAAAVVAGLQKAGSADTEKLIAAMEGLTFETPKGPMTFRKEDHQALQDMYHFRIKKDAKDNDVLELVATVPAKDMPLPIVEKK
jgi:branched-chain amino acid transport system substrate-binding protein